MVIGKNGGNDLLVGREGRRWFPVWGGAIKRGSTEGGLQDQVGLEESLTVISPH